MHNFINQMVVKSIFVFFFTILLVSCSDTKEPDNKVNDLGNRNHIELNTQTSTQTSEINNDEGPPFSDTCLCTFQEIGHIRSSPKRYDLIISGKGWNPNYHSCSWIWGELIYNESPPDTLVTDLRIHLLDLDKLDKNIDSNFLTSKTFKEKLIATFYRSDNEEYASSKFDPNQTGKYPKPKQWTE